MEPDRPGHHRRRCHSDTDPSAETALRVSIAVHDAVVAIEGNYEPYNDVRRRGYRNASPEVAAATAAFVVLRHYFPAERATLREKYVASLADVPKNRAYQKGVKVGRAAAQALIHDRRDDGRNETVTFDGPPAPGVWRPTPPPPGFVAAHMGFIEPLALRSATQFDLDGPPALRSKRYAKEFKEVKRYGEMDESARTPAQTDTAMFWSVNVFAQYNAAPGAAMTTARALARSRAQHLDRGHPDLVLAREDRPPVLASLHRHPARGHRRQPEDQARSGLGAADPEPALPRVPERTRLRHGGDDEHVQRAVRRALPRRERAAPDHGDPALRQRACPRQGDDERADLARNPLPDRDDRRQQARPPRLGLDPRPVVRADAPALSGTAPAAPHRPPQCAG